MILLRGLVFSVVITLATHLHAKEMSRPMKDMNGDCSNYKINLSKEFAEWDKAGLTVASSASEVLPVGKKMNLQLAEKDQVKFLSEPEKVIPVKGKNHSGVFNLKIPKAGAYRVAAGSKLWFDLVDKESKQKVSSSAFEMQTKCDKILKVVTFNLQPDKDYLLQISGSNKEAVSLIISKE